jgi:hypothetical protein
MARLPMVNWIETDPVSASSDQRGSDSLLRWNVGLELGDGRNYTALISRIIRNAEINKPLMFPLWKMGIKTERGRLEKIGWRISGEAFRSDRVGRRRSMMLWIRSITSKVPHPGVRADEDCGSLYSGHDDLINYLLI